MSVGSSIWLASDFMDSELLKRIRALAANDEGISGEGTRRLLAAYDALVADAQLQSAANDLNREDLVELQNRMAAAEAKSDRWQERAEAIAKERGELFRAGEKMRADLEPRRAGPGRATHESVREWDDAAQPIRDMISILANTQDQTIRQAAPAVESPRANGGAATDCL